MRSPTDALRMHYAPNKLQFMLEFGSECSSEIQTEGTSVSQNNKIAAFDTVRIDRSNSTKAENTRLSPSSSPRLVFENTRLSPSSSPRLVFARHECRPCIMHRAGYGQRKDIKLLDTGYSFNKTTQSLLSASKPFI